MISDDHPVNGPAGGSTPPPSPPPGGHGQPAAYDPVAGGSWGQGAGLAGPPPPPWERKRRARRRGWLIAATVFVVVGIPVGLAIAGALTDDGDDPEVADPESDPREGEDGTDDPVPEPDPDLDVSPPDVDGLDGADAVYGQLLVDIDESERAMITFQEEVQAAFLDRGGAGEELIEELRGVAATGVDALDSVRERLSQSLDAGRAAAIRDVYVEHLDAWMRFMAAVEEDPALLGRETDSDRFTLAINTSADAFARTLEAELPDDVDGDVRQFADGILDRGFRSEPGPEV